MKNHGLLIIVVFLFSSGCALFGGSTTEEPAGCPAHPDQPQSSTTDARHYKAADAERDFTRRRALAAAAAEAEAEAEAAKRAAQTPPQEKQAAPAAPEKAEKKSAPKLQRKKKTAPAAVAETKKPAPAADPERRKLQLEAEICDRVVEAKRETEEVRTQLEEARRKLRKQAAQARPDPEDLPPQPMRPQYTANGAVWSWRTILEGVGLFSAWLFFCLRSCANTRRH